MSNFIKGIATFLISAVAGVVQFFYKPPVQPIVPIRNENVSATTTLPSTSSSPAVISIPSSTSPNPTEETARPTPLPRRPMLSTTTPPLTPITDYLLNNLKSPFATSVTTTPSLATSLLPFLPITTTTAGVAPVTANTLPVATSSSQIIQNQPVPVSTSTVVSERIIALSSAPLTTPQKTIPLTATGPELLKIFSFSIAADSFTPDAIIVQKGDVAQLNITSSINTTLESKDLLFSTPINSGAPTSLSLLTTDVGTFVFYMQRPNLPPVFGYFVVRSR